MSSSARKPHPFAIGLFYIPTTAGAIAAGVQLPRDAVTLSIPRAQALSHGLLVPIATDEPESSTRTRGSIPLPGFIYPSTSAIGSHNFKEAEAFVRIQLYDPSLGPIPKISQADETTSAIVYASHFGQAGNLEKLLPLNVSRTSHLRFNLSRQGPLHLKINALEALSHAGEVHSMLLEKKSVGWAYTPDIKVFFALTNISERFAEVESQLLPDLLQALLPAGLQNIARTIRRRVNVIKKNAKSIRHKVEGPVVAMDLGLISAVVNRVTLPDENMPRLPPGAPKKPSLNQEVAALRKLLRKELNRTITFVKPKPKE